MTSTAYDTVIVGAGSAGCVLAARLSENPDRSVLLVEAGPVFTGLDAVPEVLRDDRTFPQEHLWTYEGFHGAGGESVPVVRGRVLGGSGSVNGVIYQRGLPEDYDGWGSPLWTDDALRPFFARIEDERDEAAGNDRSDDPEATSSGRSGGSAAATSGGRADVNAARGALPITRIGREGWAPSHRAFHDALRDLGVPENPDLLHAANQGVGPYARNSAGGTRFSAAVAYLLPALARPNLDVWGDAHVLRVNVDGVRATGIELVRDGATVRVTADEVVLSAGAIETPKLLALSGIGDAAGLRRLGVETVVDLPGVGRRLHDHPSVVTTVRLKPEIRDWDLRCLVGLVATSADAAARGGRSDLQTLVMSGPYVGNNGGALPHAPDPETVDVVLNPILYAPDCVGRLELRSTGPDERVRIHYGYLESERDRARLREAVRQAAAVFAHEAFAELIASDVGTPDAATLGEDDALDGWMARNLQTTLHGCGTCPIGPDGDPDAVVDDHGRVHGIERLRIADLSIAPRAPTAPTNATAMVIGERIAALIQNG